jgi:hypothetical protein
MRNLQIAGSTVDHVHAVAGQLKGCEDLAAIEYRHSRIVDTLEGVVRRALMVRCRGGTAPGLDTAVQWLDQVVRDHPALEGPQGEPIRAELLSIVGRIRHLAS